MENYPDDVRSFLCNSCKELSPNCVCSEKEEKRLYESALFGDDFDTYLGIFDSENSSDLIEVIREFHSNPSETLKSVLVDMLDQLLIEQIKTKLN
tara:strand:- start:9198 stop:9482 length:285 start_codon:yes stop_codon:yes gene_type:complete